jgi:hypothetical protein
MSKRTTIICLAIVPVLFLLSWYISHRMYDEFLRFGTGVAKYKGEERSLVYACYFTGLYLAIFLVMRDLYKPKGKKKNVS